MARAMILPLPASGHVNPTLPVARELVARGEEVIYCLPDQFKPSIQATGAALLPFTITGRAFRWSPVPCADLLLWLPLHTAVTSLEILPHLLERVRAAQPDYLIYDAWCLWGRLVARILHLPAIRCQPTFVMNEQLGPTFWTMLEQADRLAMSRVSQAQPSEFEQQVNFAAALEELRSTYNVPVIDLKSFFDHAEVLNLVPIPRAFQPDGQTFDDRFQFVGPSLLPQEQGTNFPLDRLKQQPTLYISLGTVCNDEEAFYKMCFAAFAEGRRAGAGEGSRAGEQAHQPHWQVVLASGKSDLSVLGSPPENFLVRPRVPQLEVLQHSRVFLTHGGMNSVMEGLYYGVPLVVIPQMLEQRITAKRVEELGLGIALESSAVTVDLLQEPVMRVTSDREIRRRVQQMQETLRQMGGAQSAADAVLRFSRTEGQKGWSWPSRVEPGSLLKARATQAKVFGIGLSRTGTTSLTQALHLLGYKAIHFPHDSVTRAQVYHFFASELQCLSLALLQEADAITDTPVCCLYQALDQAYPGSKFILTVREKHSWLRSCRSFWVEQVEPYCRAMPASWLAQYSRVLHERLYGTQEYEQETFSRAYDAYTAEVREYFRERPQDLLVLDICGGEGWSKLAPFLEVPIPEAPFPWENRGNKLSQWRQQESLAYPAPS